MNVEQRLAIQLGNNAANAAMMIARLETELEAAQKRIAELEAATESVTDDK